MRFLFFLSFFTVFCFLIRDLSFFFLHPDTIFKIRCLHSDLLSFKISFFFSLSWRFLFTSGLVIACLYLFFFSLFTSGLVDVQFSSFLSLFFFLFFLWLSNNLLFFTSFYVCIRTRDCSSQAYQPLTRKKSNFTNANITTHSRPGLINPKQRPIFQTTWTAH